MINKLEIKNFQSHKNSELEFSPGVNVIVGTSDSGKSAVIRALRWIIENKPRGEGFRSHWGGETSVEITLPDKQITRKKTNSENSYQIDDDSLFKALGTGVPEEVEKVLNLDELNLQKQADSPFLLSNSPGEVAQHFNRMASLDKIDTSIKAVQRDLRATDQKLIASKEQLSEQNQQLKQYAFIPALEKEIQELEQKQKEAETIVLQVKDLIQTRDSVKDISLQIKEHSKLFPALSYLENILSLIQQRKGITTQISALQELADDVNGTKIQIEHNCRIINVEKIVDTLLQLRSDKKDVQKNGVLLKDKVESIKSTQKLLVKTRETVKKQQDEFHTNFPETCPLCGNKTK